MKTVLAEKPSVAKDIARVLGANEKKDGYLEGAGWRVTWAFGHLVTLAEPSEYDEAYKAWRREQLPIVPSEFVYRAVDDAGARKQLKVIRTLFKEATEIVCATDAGREGEAIFRYIYNEVGCTKPFRRLWISSLTDSAIKEGFASLKDGSEYDNLYHSAKARNEADWLVGLNATRALTIASQSAKPLSLGRVQTPTLALVAARYLENKNFVPKPFYTPFLLLEAQGRTFKAFSDARFDGREDAQGVLDRVSTIVTVRERRQEKRQEKAPLPFDITSLQAQANKAYGFGAKETLDTVQSLYEKHKMLTYPRTGSRYLGEDMIEGVRNALPSLRKASLKPALMSGLEYIEKSGVNTVCFNSKKLTDHHAIIPTFQNIESRSSLTDKERKIYDMVVRQLILALLPPCVKEVLSYEFAAGEKDDTFKSSGSRIIEAGWRMALGGEETADDDSSKDDEEESQLLPDLKEGQGVDVRGKDIREGMTKCPPLLTEATLLKAMETAGRLCESEEDREAMKECGLGTPATRAAIIDTLYKRGYMVSEKNKLSPTETGLQVYNLTRGQLIGDAALTGQWERKLNLIAEGKADAVSFRSEAEQMARDLTSRLLLTGAGVSSSSSLSGLKCPVCGKPLTESQKAYGCSGYKDGCRFTLWKTIGGRTVTEKHLRQLVTDGQTEVIKGMKSKDGKTFDAAVAWDSAEGRLKYVFPEKSQGETAGKCPKCGKDMMLTDKGLRCSDRECGLALWREVAGKKLTDAHLKALAEKGETAVLKGFKSKTGKTFDAALTLDRNTWKVTFRFPDKGSAGK